MLVRAIAVRDDLWKSTDRSETQWPLDHAFDDRPYSATFEVLPPSRNFPLTWSRKISSISRPCEPESLGLCKDHVVFPSLNHSWVDCSTKTLGRSSSTSPRGLNVVMQLHNVSWAHLDRPPWNSFNNRGTGYQSVVDDSLRDNYDPSLINSIP